MVSDPQPTALQGLPENCTVVVLEDWISAHKCRFFHKALGNEQAIKGISVVLREIF